MAKARKTIDVANIINQLNKTLRKSDLGVLVQKETVKIELPIGEVTIVDDLEEKRKIADRTEGRNFRQGICEAIEKILFETENYQGFRYIDKNGEAIKPYAWGCDYSKLTDTVEEQVAAFEGSDDTRRQYFIGRIK